MKTKIAILTLIGAGILALNAYFLPTLSQDVALDSVNSSIQTWRAYSEVAPLVKITELVGFVLFSGWLLLKQSNKQ